MASTNQTNNYGLPIYSAGDRATWSDTNQPFANLDVAVKKAVDESGFIGIFMGGLKSSAGGITAAIVSGLIVSLIFRAKDKS